jgi:hypothetical protein
LKSAREVGTLGTAVPNDKESQYLDIDAPYQRVPRVPLPLFLFFVHILTQIALVGRFWQAEIGKALAG